MIDEPRPMTGFWATLTPEQQALALAYDGPETHGDPAFALKLFRGLSEDVWTERFKLRGYPPEAAREMAGFLVGRVTSPPRWGEVVPDPQSGDNLTLREKLK